MTTRALVIKPDNTYAVTAVNRATLRGMSKVVTPHAIIWHGYFPANWMATYLWWKLCPAMEGLDHLGGTCFVTGPGEDSVSLAVIDLYERLDAARVEDLCIAL